MEPAALLIFYITTVHFYKRDLKYACSFKVYFFFFGLAAPKTKIVLVLHTLDPESFYPDFVPKLISKLLWLVHILLMT